MASADTHFVTVAACGVQSPLIMFVCSICSDSPKGQRVMFAAILKGSGKAKVMGALGVKRMKQICAELDAGGDFKCDKIHGTGAAGFVRTQLVAQLGLV
jgi:hypothetical protein